MDDSIELLREYRRGDKVYVTGYGKGVIALVEKGKYHINSDSNIPLPHRVFTQDEFEPIKESLMRKFPHEADYEALEDWACAAHRIADALCALGTGNAASQMGAIEFLAVQLKEGLSEIASALTGLSDDEYIKELINRANRSKQP